MEWFMRGRSDMYVYAPRECPQYSENCGLFSIKMYHGGDFNPGMSVYSGGKVDYFDCCDVDKLSLIEIVRMYSEAGEKGCATEYWYKDPKEEIDGGIRPLETDSDVMAMCSVVPGTDYVEVFVVSIKPISVENLPLRSTPTTPTDANVIPVDDSDDECNSEERVRQQRKLVDEILEGEGLSKSFSEIERERAEDKARRSKRKKKSRGKKPHFEPEVEEGDVHSWHDDDSNKDMSDIEGHFDPFMAGGEFNEHDHVDRRNETVENENVPNVESGPARGEGDNSHANNDQGNEGAGEDQGNQGNDGAVESDREEFGAFPDSDPEYHSGDEKMAVSSDDEIDTMYPEFNEKVDMVSPTFELGMIFSSAAIITMLKEIHLGVMTRIVSRREKILQKGGHFCTNAVAKLSEASKKSGGCSAIWSGGSSFHVQTHEGGHELTVNITNKTCACRKWQLSGIPCFHAVAAYKKRDLNPEQGIDNYFTVQTTLKAYSYFVEPINGMEFWEKTAFPAPLPPNIKVKPGRPKKKRSRTNDVTEDGIHLKRTKTTITCRSCKAKGHNVASCPDKADERAAKKAEAAAKKAEAAATAGQAAGENNEAGPSQPPQENTPAVKKTRKPRGKKQKATVEQDAENVGSYTKAQRKRLLRPSD